MAWSAAQYSRFEDERNRPIHDLLAQIPLVAPAQAVDLGCGPGNSTELLRQHFEDTDVIGVDSSADMLAAARKRLPNVPFEEADIACWNGAARFDLIFSNAVLQWLPDHASLLPRLLARVAPGGCLAVQMPDNLMEPAHQIMREIAAQDPWADRLARATRPLTGQHSPEWYYRVLSEAGARVNVWRTTYHHALQGGPAAIVEWFKGSALRPLLEALDEAERPEFLARYESALSRTYPSLAGGVVLLPCPRLFFVASR